MVAGSLNMWAKVTPAPVMKESFCGKKSKGQTSQWFVPLMSSVQNMVITALSSISFHFMLTSSELTYLYPSRNSEVWIEDEKIGTCGILLIPVAMTMRGLHAVQSNALLKMVPEGPEIIKLGSISQGLN